MPPSQVIKCSCLLCGSFACEHLGNKPLRVEEPADKIAQQDDAEAWMVRYAICDLWAKTIVRGREAARRRFAQGYCLFVDHVAGVKFLRCEGRPDLIYEDD